MKKLERVKSADLGARKAAYKMELDHLSKGGRVSRKKRTNNNSNNSSTVNNSNTNGAVVPELRTCSTEEGMLELVRKLESMVEESGQNVAMNGGEVNVDMGCNDAVVVVVDNDHNNNNNNNNKEAVIPLKNDIGSSDKSAEVKEDLVKEKGKQQEQEVVDDALLAIQPKISQENNENVNKSNLSQVGDQSNFQQTRAMDISNESAEFKKQSTNKSEEEGKEVSSKMMKKKSKSKSKMKPKKKKFSNTQSIMQMIKPPPYPPSPQEKLLIIPRPPPLPPPRRLLFTDHDDTHSRGRLNKTKTKKKKKTKNKERDDIKLEEKEEEEEEEASGGVEEKKNNREYSIVIHKSPFAVDIMKQHVLYDQFPNIDQVLIKRMFQFNFSSPPSITEEDTLLVPHSSSSSSVKISNNDETNGNGYCENELFEIADWISSLTEKEVEEMVQVLLFKAVVFTNSIFFNHCWNSPSIFIIKSVIYSIFAPQNRHVLASTILFLDFDQGLFILPTNEESKEVVEENEANGVGDVSSKKNIETKPSEAMQSSGGGGGDGDGVDEGTVDPSSISTRDLVIGDEEMILDEEGESLGRNHDIKFEKSLTEFAVKLSPLLLNFTCFELCHHFRLLRMNKVYNEFLKLNQLKRRRDVAHQSSAPSTIPSEISSDSILVSSTFPTTNSSVPATTTTSPPTTKEDHDVVDNHGGSNDTKDGIESSSRDFERLTKEDELKCLSSLYHYISCRDLQLEDEVSDHIIAGICNLADLAKLELDL
jgi:hypothetical protein